MSAPGVSRLPNRCAWPKHAAVIQPEHELWGLTPARLGELRAELDDHLLCLQREDGQPAAQAARESVRQPRARRALAAPHLADQVYATLNRRPTRQEWRELYVLLAWFALILLADALAGWALPRFGEYRFMVSPPLPPPSVGVILLEVAAWLLQAVARAGFFTALVLSLLRAWKIGGGVCLARVLQLKLIHTLLVAAALMGLGRFVWRDDFYGYGYTLAWPSWFIAPVILAAGFILALLALTITRGRAWAPALGIALTILFLYPGGPLAVYKAEVTTPLAYSWNQQTGRASTLVIETDKAIIAQKAAKMRRYKIDAVIDEEANQFTMPQYYLKPALGAYTERGNYRLSRGPSDGTDWGGYRVERQVGQWAVSGPLAAPGGGIGWLAVPIPLLGIIGFVGLLGVMGRRSFGDFMLYAVLCAVGLLTNLLPFFVASEATYHPFLWKPEALMSSPFVGFESLLSEPEFSNGMWLTLVFGLLFSAAMPWLLTALFLRPRATASLPGAGDTMEACQ